MLRLSILLLGAVGAIGAWPFEDKFGLLARPACWSANERFVECGGCEGTCAAPVVKNCQKCKPPRCECPMDAGFVRARECPGPSILSMDPDQIRLSPAQALVEQKKKKYYPIAKLMPQPPVKSREYPSKRRRHIGRVNK